jgi:hypothetical protein
MLVIAKVYGSKIFQGFYKKKKNCKQIEFSLKSSISKVSNQLPYIEVFDSFSSK